MNSTTNDPNQSQSPLEQQGRKRSHIRIVAFIVGLHVVFLGGMLIQGCKPGETAKTPNGNSTLATNEGGLAQENPSYYKSLDPASNGVASQGNYPAPEVGASSNAVAHGPQPPVVEPSNPLPAQAASEYEIKAGDTFAKVAKNHGVGVKAILAANSGVDAARLKIGQKIQIPATQPASSDQATHKDGTPKGTAMKLDKPSPGSSGDYSVKPGDSLIKIAKSHGISVKTLKSVNGLKTDRIHVGQTLKMPAAAAAVSKETASAPGTPATN